MRNFATPSIAASILAALVASSALGMTFSVIGQDTDYGWNADWIIGTGPVEQGDALRFEHMMEQLPKSSHWDGVAWTISLESPGGDLLEGIRLGETFRRLEVSTAVQKSKTCASACAIAFLGGATSGAMSSGVRRFLELGGRLGFHGYSVAQDLVGPAKETLDQARIINALIRDYAIRMGVTDIGFLLGLFNTPPDDLEYIDTPRELLNLRINLEGKDLWNNYGHLRPPKSWAMHACRYSVARMLQPMDPMGIDGRVLGPAIPMKNPSHFLKSFLDAKYPLDMDEGPALQPIFMGMDPVRAVDILAGRQLMIDQSPISIWEIDLERGATFYYDTCFAISNFQTITTIVVDRVGGDTATQEYLDTLQGFPPDEPLWK
ncbi:hypothetical protein [Cereibacter sphaeroides]|uniref:COG3904 family protein n=1 Tax=Cereibacter sphaeroides TaxID=1063 RepID=UPI000F51BB29|nr:hypothetical protein [Cereibacter sphaeroides]AZB70277.1 hypothetical protein EBL86_17925 [Cereibacter sphaeroides]